METEVWIVSQTGRGYPMVCSDEQCDECPHASNCWQIGGCS